MKYAITLLSIVCSINCFSQTPDPDLFQTWYLHDFYSTDDNIHYPVSAVNPSISPYVTFTESLTFNGTGACNSFFGTFSSPVANFIDFDDFSITLLMCNTAEHNSYEGGFFSFMYSGRQYFLSGEGNNMYLVISSPIFTNYVFGNFPLSTTDVELKQTLVYPNPVDSELFVVSQNNVIDKIEIFNSIGQTVKTVNNNFEMIDLSDFISGIYLVKLHSQGKTTLKKIMKK